jgi:ABC-type multidrug transport system fused ATPase/permease subunit
MVAAQRLAAVAGLARRGCSAGSSTRSPAARRPGRTGWPLAVLAVRGRADVLARYALAVGYRFGERTAARVREGFLDRRSPCPPRWSSGCRPATWPRAAPPMSDAVATTLRDVLPEVLIAAVQALFMLGAVLVLTRCSAWSGVLGLSGIWFVTRWYLRRARDAYLDEGAANSVLADELAATTAGARTIEAFGLRSAASPPADAAIAETRRTRLATLFLRSVLLPAGGDLVRGAGRAGAAARRPALHRRGRLTLGTVAAAVLYLRQLVGPLDTILIWIEQLQSSGASFARVEGLAAVPPRRR